MDSDPASKAARTHTNGWITVLSLGLSVFGLSPCLYVLVGFPAEAQVTGGSTAVPAVSTPPPAIQPYRRQQLQVAAAPAATLRDHLRQSQETLREAADVQRRVRTVSALFLGVFAIIAALIVIQVYLQARAWDRDSSRAVAEVE